MSMVVVHVNHMLHLGTVQGEEHNSLHALLKEHSAEQPVFVLYHQTPVGTERRRLKESDVPLTEFEISQYQVGTAAFAPLNAVHSETVHVDAPIFDVIIIVVTSVSTRCAYAYTCSIRFVLYLPSLDLPLDGSGPSAAARCQYLHHHSDGGDPRQLAVREVSERTDGRQKRLTLDTGVAKVSCRESSATVVAVRKFLFNSLLSKWKSVEQWGRVNVFVCYNCYYHHTKLGEKPLELSHSV
jgi:hypothetical protein